MSTSEEYLEHTLRPMREQDLETVFAIESTVFSHGWTLGIFQDCLRVGYSCAVIEDHLGQVCAYGILSVGPGEAHILNISVAPQRQRQGLGRRMLLHLQKLAHAHKAEVIFLEVRPSNQGAIALYEDDGFHQVGLRRDYYPAEQGREDAMIMAKHLLGL